MLQKQAIERQRMATYRDNIYFIPAWNFTFKQYMVNALYLSLINPYPAKLNNLNFQPLEFVSRYRDPQLQVAENYCYLEILMFKHLYHSK